MENNPKSNLSRGQVIVAAMLALVILSIMVPILVYLTQREAVWSTKDAFNDLAFRMAEAGQDKAYFVLSQNPASWASIINGTPLTGFNFDQDYADTNISNGSNLGGRTNQGQYTISIASGPSTNQVTIISVGENMGKTQIRAIKAVYDESPPQTVAFAQAFNSTMTMHWAPIMSRTNITIPPANTLAPCYPQMYAITGITVNQSAAACFGGAALWSATQSPCTDNKLWWAYNCPPGVPNAPIIDLTNYYNQAWASSCPNGAPYNFPFGSGAAGNCYWSWTQNFNASETTFNSTATVYINGDLTIANGKLLQGTLIVTGNLTVNSVSGGATYTIPDTYSNGISTTAWQQYQGGTPPVDTGAPDEWPGDNGGGPPSTINNSFTFGSATCGASPCAATCDSDNCSRSGTKDAPMLRGFIYVGGNLIVNTNMVYHGVLIVNGTITTNGSAKLTGYYDPTVASRILVTNSTPARISWSNVVYSRWPGP